MPRGQSGHRRFEEFDIAAILNFMAQCKHFKKFHQGQLMTKVINLRNTVMHSPEFRLNKEKMSNGRNNVLLLLTCLYTPDHDMSNILKYCVMVQLKLLKLFICCILLEREQQALKEKIEFLAQRYDGMKNFLDQNKDLLESLRPQVNRLNEIQETVEKHEFQLDNLNNRVGNLEKFKNHLIEQARKRKWPEPLFTEELDANGKGSVTSIIFNVYLLQELRCLHTFKGVLINTQNTF
uniref:Uncharacterized protein n=1 Tax=Pygocentrus nattereri TaxID=42514 RepID=A0AAR2JXR2_PYGNA